MNQDTTRQSAAQLPGMSTQGVNSREANAAPGHPTQQQQQRQGQRRRYKPKPQTTSTTEPQGLPPPKALSTKGTTPVNDPLSDSVFFPLPGSEFGDLAGEKHIYSGADGLMDVVDAEYVKLAANSFNLKRNISHSGYAYYAACLTWARMLFVAAENGGVLTFEEKQLIDQVRDLTPPKLLGAYIAGIGNTKYPSGFHELKFGLVKPPLANDGGPLRLPGYFGKLDENARYYAAYPCIAVFAQRVVADISHTEQNGPSDWDLPADFNVPNRLPTPSCIGYREAVTLDRSQVGTYSLVGITGNRFPYSLETLAVSKKFLNEIQAWINEVRDIVTVPSPVMGSASGSRAQLVATYLDTPIIDINSSQFQAFSCEYLGSGPENAGAAFKYRLDKNPTGVGSIAKKIILSPYICHQADLPLYMNFLRDYENDDMLAVLNGGSNPYTCAQRLDHMARMDRR